MGRAYCRGACCFILASWIHRASSCWYFCWYRQQLTDKMNLNSDGYGNRRLPARGTTLRPCGLRVAQPRRLAIYSFGSSLPVQAMQSIEAVILFQTSIRVLAA